MLRYFLARRSDWTVFVVACTISLSLMLLNRSGQARAAWFLQHTLLAPVSTVVGWWDRGVGLYWDNERLRARLTRMQIELDGATAERAENTRLRSLLGLAERHPYELIAARVVGRSLDRLGGSLTIDKGEEDGVFANRAVLTPDGLVGRVERSTAHGARVLTLLHRDCAVAARVERSRVDGVVRWEFGEQPTLNLLYVSSQEDVKVGDRIQTSGLGGIFPSGIRIGTVTRIGLEENGLMKEITVRPAVNFRTLEELLAYSPATLPTTVPSDLFPAETSDSLHANASADSIAAVGQP
jgi:rod shape-determining protein MreC